VQCLAKAPIHERRKHQQHDRDGDLAADQETASPASPPPDGCLSSFHDRCQVGARRLNRWSEPEYDRAQHGDDETEPEGSAVELEGECYRQISR
jgi:hypothetical protein